MEAVQVTECSLVRTRSSVCDKCGGGRVPSETRMYSVRRLHPRPGLDWYWPVSMVWAMVLLSGAFLHGCVGDVGPPITPQVINTGETIAVSPAASR